MSKLISVTLGSVNVSESAANPFLSADGLLNYTKVEALQEKIAALIKASAKPAVKGQPAEPIKASATYVKRARAKTTPYRAAAHTKGTDLKYRAARAVKIAMRKRLAPEALARVSIVLQVIDAPKLNAQIKQCVSAIAMHVTRTEKHLTKLSTEKAKIRDKANSVFEKSTAMLNTVLLQGGVKGTDIVESIGMMGRTVMIKLGPDNYVSVTKADKVRFAAAQKASKAA